jgi:integrase
MKPVPRCKKTRASAKSILRLPDLEIAKSAVLNSLSCPDAQRNYRHAIDEFVDWYCPEPRLSFSKTAVVRYRMHLESRGLAPGTINLRLGAVKGKRDRALLALLLACGLRRHELAKLTLDHLQQREGHWAIVGDRRPAGKGRSRSDHSRAWVGAWPVG